MKARIRTLVRSLPAWLALPLLRGVSALEWQLREGRRARALQHMGRLLGGTAREAEVPELARRSVLHRRGLEYLLWNPRFCVSAPIDGGEILRAAQAGGTGVLVAHSHLCWIAPQVYALSAQGYVDAIVMARDDPPTELQRLYQRVFDDWHVEVIDAARSFERILTRLREGRVVQIAVDVPGSTPCLFLDKPASLVGGVAALARSSGAPIVLVTPRWTGWRLRVAVGRPIHADAYGDAPALTRHLADLVSRDVLAAPELYHDHDWLDWMWTGPSAD